MESNVIPNLICTSTWAKTVVTSQASNSGEPASETKGEYEKGEANATANPCRATAAANLAMRGKCKQERDQNTWELFPEFIFRET